MDVGKNVFSNTPQTPGKAVIVMPVTGTRHSVAPKFYEKFPISGDPLSNNGYLDNRFVADRVY